MERGERAKRPGRRSGAEGRGGGKRSIGSSQRGEEVAGPVARGGEARATDQEPGSRGTEQVQPVSEAFGPEGAARALKRSALLLFSFFSPFFCFNLALRAAHPGLQRAPSLRRTDQPSTKRSKQAANKIKIRTPPAQQNKLEQTNYRQSTHKQWSICGSPDCGTGTTDSTCTINPDSPHALNTRLFSRKTIRPLIRGLK